MVLQLFGASIIMKSRGAIMAEFTLQIDGMHCGSCVRRVSQALSQAEGLTVKEVRVGGARVESDQPGALDRAVEAVNKAGFKAHSENSATAGQ
jgi:copper chaperone CopZ